MTGTMKLISGIVIVLLGISLYADFSVLSWGDQDWELLVARMLIDGKKLYIDHVPVTGPLLFYLYTLPAFLSQHISFLQDNQLLAILTLLTTAAVIAACTRLIAQHPGFAAHSQKLYWILLLCFLLVIRIRPPFMGDREHLFIILALPYLLRFMPSLSNMALSVRTRILIGAAAAIGFCLKPHCILLFIGIQIVHIAYTRSPRIVYSLENIAIYILGMLYCAIIGIFTPEYFSLVLPMAYYTYSALHTITVIRLNLILSVILTFVMLRPNRDSVYRKDIYYFTALLPFLFLYIYVNNGWLYTYQPFMTVLLLTNGFVLWEFLASRPEWKPVNWKALLGAALCIANFSLEAFYECNYAKQVWIHPCHGDAACPGYYQPFVDDIRRQHARSFGTLGMGFALWARVSKLSGAQWDTRFPQFWMLPKFLISGKDFYDKHRDIFHYVTNALAHDLNANKPELVFVENSQNLYTITLSKPLNWVETFSGEASFKQAWKHYAFLHTIDNCSIFTPSVTATEPPPEGVKVIHFNCLFDVYKRLPQ